jgi:uncharacterized protein (DUF342 family)
MGLSISTAAMPGTVYVPAFRGNRQDKEPFYVEVMPMTAAEMAAKKQRDLGGHKNQGANVQKTARTFRDSIIEARCPVVVGVEGVDVDGKPIAVSTGKDLVALIGRAADASMDDLAEEIYAAITDHSLLAEGRRPNS